MGSILIVNNDENFLARLTAILITSGYHVIVTNNSLNALDLFKKYKPCAVIIDIYMNEKDGFEVTKEIRAICRKTFILVISARSDCLNIITHLGADLALPVSTHAELIVNVMAVAEKEQLMSKNNCLLSDECQRKKNYLKVA